MRDAAKSKRLRIPPEYVLIGRRALSVSENLSSNSFARLIDACFPK